MPTHSKTAQANSPGPRARLAGVAEGGRRFLFGDDVFISYSRRQASDYALALADELTRKGLSCFLDQFGTPPGQRLPEPLLRSLGRSTMLVLVGTKRAAASRNVRIEVETFLKTGRTLIPITFVADADAERARQDDQADVRGSLEKADWYERIRGVALTFESERALEDNRPSGHVVSRIVNARGFRSRRARLRNLFWLTLASVCLLLAVGGAFVYLSSLKVAASERSAKEALGQVEQARQDLKEVNAQLTSSQTALEQARDGERAARDAELAANEQAADAGEKAQAAEDRRQDAERNAAEADKKAGEAARREREANAVAERQQRRAYARELAAQSETIRQEQSGPLSLSVLLAVESLRHAAVPEGDRAMRRSLGLMRRRVGALELPSTDEDEALYFSPDGKYLVFKGDEAGEVFVWEAWATASPKKTTLPHDGGVYNVAFSPKDPKLMATACADGKVRLWDLSKGGLTREPFGHESEVYDVTFAPDGALLATGSKDGTVRFWNVAQGREEVERRLNVLDEENNNEPAGVKVVEFNPLDAGEVLTASDDQWLRLWDARQKKVLAKDDISEDVFVAKFSPDASLVVTDNGDVTQLWEVQRARPEGEGAAAKVTLRQVLYETGGGGYGAVAFSPDGSHMANGPHKEVVVRVLKDGKASRIPARLVHTTFVEGVAFSADGKYVCTTSQNSTHLWTTQGGEEVARVNHGEPASAAWAAMLSPDTKHVIVPKDDKTVEIYDLSGGGDDTDYWDVAFSPDRRLAAWWAGERYKVRDWETGREFDGKAPEGAYYARLAVGPGGEHLAFKVADSVRLLNPATGEWNAVEQPGGYSSQLSGMKFDDTGKRLGVLNGGRLGFWEVEGGRLVRPVPIPPDLDEEINAFAFSPGSRLAATGSDTGRVRVWDAATAKEIEGARLELRERETGKALAVVDVAFSPDGRRLAAATGDKTVRLYDFDGRTLSNEKRLKIQASPASLAFSPAATGDYLAVGTDDGVRVWGLDEGVEVARIGGDGLTVATAFSRDAKQVFALQRRDVREATGRAKSWAWRPDDLINAAFEKLGPGLKTLTRSEAGDYLNPALPCYTCLPD